MLRRRSLALLESAKILDMGSVVWGERESRTVSLVRLEDGTGAWAEVTNYGAAWIAAAVPDRNGVLADVVLGMDSLAGYASRQPYFGAIVGRFANRIGGGRFVLDGQEVVLATNDAPGGAPCHLHGGERGFDKKVWEIVARSDSTVTMELESPDGDEGYPGALSVRLRYTWEAQTLRMEVWAETSAPTVVNLANHAYFNLCGHGEGDVLGHHLTLDCSAFTPTDRGMIPTGEVRPVDGTPMDFRAGKEMGEGIDGDDEQIRFGGGYDHNWVIDRARPGLVRAARVVEPVSGRTLEVWTTEPGVQFYAGNMLDVREGAKDGAFYGRRSGFCLETQKYPDSPNHPHFPSCVLRPGEQLASVTEYRFAVE